MTEVLFVLGLVVPPAVIAMSAAALWIGSVAHRRESPSALRHHHA